MDQLIVASVQQQMRLFDSLDDFRKDAMRFIHMAHAKGVQLVVFPALSGVMALSPRLQGLSLSLLRQAEQQGRGKANLWERTRKSLKGGAAALLGANFRTGLLQALKADPTGVVADYEGVFAELARTYELTIVGGSAYLPDAQGVLRHRTTVFGPDGAVLGRHDKMALSLEDEGLAVQGEAWHVVETPVGRLGILLGEETLYPEAGRILAYQGADILVALAAAADERMAAYIRFNTMARAQDNRCFALTSFLVGKNYLAEGEAGTAFGGRSGLYAPLSMTPRYSGILVEMGAADAEGLITAQLDREELRQVWETEPEPVRSRMPVELFAAYLPALYGSRHTLADTWPGVADSASALLLPQPTEGEPGEERPDGRPS